jgi:FtsP/CotA-like multicopper oxidase with cupredoxin domain
MRVDGAASIVNVDEFVTAVTKQDPVLAAAPEVNLPDRVRPRWSAGAHPLMMGPNGPAARKDAVLVAPLQTIDIDFDTDNPGRWITHCHNAYHLESGMATFIYHT